MPWWVREMLIGAVIGGGIGAALGVIIGLAVSYRVNAIMEPALIEAHELVDDIERTNKWLRERDR